MTIDTMDQLKVSPDMKIQQLIQDDLKKMEQVMLSEVLEFHPDLKAATELILSSGGKKLRPRIILLVGRLLEAEHDPLITLAASIEMLHNATLVHDDFIDGALLRRGIPTLNSNWSPAATVLAGDFLFGAASELASKTNSVEIMNLFARTLRIIVNGEIRQMLFNRSVTGVEEYYKRIYAKTASLFETSTQSAAMISNSSVDTIESFRKYGYGLGMAFQIVDDILDYTGSEKSIGKPVGGDLRQGLITLPMIKFIHLYPDDAVVQKLCAGEYLTNEEDIQHLLQAIPESDAIEEAYQDAARFVRDAETELMKFPIKPERDELLEISRFIVDRKI